MYERDKWLPPRDVRFLKTCEAVTNRVVATAYVYQTGGRTTADAY